MRKEGWFFLVVIFISLVIPVVVIFTYRSFVTGLPFGLNFSGISHKSEDWSAFGSLISGLFTLAGAIATLATLLFAYWQNNKLSKEAEKRTEMDKETAKKNESFMDFQKKIMQFEKYKMHKEAFNDELTILERDLINNETFESRSILYKRIFPNNSFSHCETYIDMNLVCNEYGLAKVYETMKGFEGRLKDGWYYKNNADFVKDVNSIKKLLMISAVGSGKYGEITSIDNKLILNIYSLKEEVSALCQAANQIFLFCENDMLPDFSEHIDLAGLFCGLHRHSIYFLINQFESPLFPYRFKHHELIHRAVELYHYLQGEKDIDVRGALSEAYAFMNEYFSSEKVRLLMEPSSYWGFAKGISDAIYKARESAAKAPDMYEVAGKMSTYLYKVDEERPWLKQNYR
ncbi:hypothetical protein AB6T85_07705 [Erwinia sp. ACCC 02193]|uniref:Phage abortive infection protein n=1 Tax=Erwinia aeris TaxID=3239803 RepID=A0ABV4E666_9GAMM